MDTRHIPRKQGQQDFDRFVRHHASPVLAYCLRRSSHADAHEVATEVFATAWRKFAEVPKGEPGLYWLLAVARRVLANQRRGHRRRTRLTDRVASLAAPTMPSPETVVVRNAQDQAVIDALRTLDPKDQEILALIVWDEVPREEASNLLEISVAAVHKRYQRALHRMERALLSGAETAARPTR